MGTTYFLRVPCFGGEVNIQFQSVFEKCEADIVSVTGKKVWGLVYEV